MSAVDGPTKRSPRESGDLIERLRLLRQQDWERMTMVLLKYAAQRLCDLGIPPVGGSIRGVGIEDLVHDAIEAVWSGRRSWDHEKVPLVTFLKNVVSSSISNLFDLSEVKEVDPWPQEGAEEDPGEDVMMRKHADPAHDHARHLPERPKTPEETLAEREEVERLDDLFMEAAGDDDELIRYLDTLDRGIEKPSLIAREWGVKPEVIYRVENRFRHRLKRIAEHKNAIKSEDRR
jgi:hypothetical protein